MTGIDRLANAMFIGFAIRPESSTLIPLDLTDIQLDAIYSRHFRQSDSYRAVLLRILEIVQSKLALPYVRTFSSHVGEVPPCIGATSMPVLSSLPAIPSLTDRMTGTTSKL